MFVLVTFVEYPHLEDYTLRSVELYPSAERAQMRSKEPRDAFIEEYEARPWNDPSSNGGPFSVATNGEVTFRSYIDEVPED